MVIGSRNRGAFRLDRILPRSTLSATERRSITGVMFSMKLKRCDSRFGVPPASTDGRESEENEDESRPSSPRGVEGFGLPRSLLAFMSRKITLRSLEVAVFVREY